MNESQKSAFLDGEGDAWFRRNRAAGRPETEIERKTRDMLAAYLKPGDRALEIGAADGSNLAALHDRIRVRFGAPILCHGIDPSAEAVAQGRLCHPFLELRQATAEALPYPDSHFQLVWFGFCFSLLDRELLMRAVAEADRVLADGGFLAITDFDPPLPARRAYRHRHGVFSWKMDYSRLFLANPAYVLVEKASYSHHAPVFHADPGERIATWILAKTPEGAYRHEEDR